MGCMDPTIEKTGGVTHKSDIYSFGVVLFEILCERKALIQNEVDRSLAQMAKYGYENGTLYDIIHPHLLNQILSPQSLLIYSKVAYSCLNDDRAHRPDTHYIVAKLEKALELQLRHENIYLYFLFYLKERKFGHLKIRLGDIKLATNNFSKTYGIASVASECTLYRAELHCFDKKNPSSEKGKNIGEHPKAHNIVVIKRYTSGNKWYGEKELYTEIEMLSSVEHPNIVTLIGFCIEDSEMILVTDNVSNGYLRNYLRNDNDMRFLTWEKRLKICMDVANALEHLHSEMEDQKMIIHRDICSYNIGLDQNWRAKIDGFGNCVFLPPNQEDEAVYINLRGRPVYIDPEYEKTYKLKRESDVYSFGIVLLEILCGRAVNDPIYLKESHKGLGRVARQSFCTGTLEDIIDPILKEETSEYNFVLKRGPNKESLHTFMKIAYQCLAETQDQRPTMKVVVKELEKALSFQLNSEVKSDYVEEKSHASVIETQVVELFNEVNSMNMTDKSENFEIHNKENMLHDQTDDPAEPDC
ncbi:receptor-like protein kinase ANXUR2 [Helianthus annuus]|uniref:receptor-like protein kinase ANXUR2 n=1 Tax=Helianthus annuus TaxID=4232 RepID=UPI0016530576|nr:receptor-like protein kinase ANXUR2 [Helianthus annuus]